MTGPSTISREGMKQYPCQLDLDDEASAPLRADLEKALNFIRSFGWDAPVRMVFNTWGVGGLIVVFGVHFDRDAVGPPASGLWVVVGDIPSAFFIDDIFSKDRAVADAAAQRMDEWGDAKGKFEFESPPETAAKVYCQRMDGWIQAVRTGADLTEFAPMDLAPTLTNADALEAKIKFIRDVLFTSNHMDYLGARENEDWLPDGAFWPYQDGSRRKLPFARPMDVDLATLILLACHRSAKELADIAPLINQYCDEDDAKALRLPIGHCIHDILENVAGYVARRCPEAQAELDARHDRFGRTI